MKQILILLLLSANTAYCAKGLYEVVFVNTTNQEFTYSIDQLADIEKGAGKKIFKGGDIKGTIKPLDAKTGAPSVAHTTTTMAYEIKKVTITTGTGQKMVYNIPSKAGNDLRGKDWVFTIVHDDKGSIQVCRKWSHTKLQNQMTIAAEVTAIIAGVVAITIASGGTDLAAAGGAGGIAEPGAVAGSTSINALGAGGDVVSATTSGQIVTLADGTQIASVALANGQTTLATGYQGVWIIAEESAIPALTNSYIVALQAAGLTSEAMTAIATAEAAGAAIAAGLTVASAAVIGALEIASEKTEGALSSAWKQTKAAFSKAFGLSRKMNKAGCSYFTSKKAKKKK